MAAQPVAMQPPAMPVSPRAIRKDELIVAIVFLVFAIVLLGAVVYVAVCGCGPPGAVRRIDVSLQVVGGNWSLTVVDASPDLDLNSVTLTVISESGSAMMPMYNVPLSMLTEARWATHGVLYEKVANETRVMDGARIVVSMALYPAECRWQLADAIGILSTGTFHQ